LRVAFSPEILEKTEAWDDLDRILYTVDDGWHLWEVEDPGTVEASTWFEQAGRRQVALRELLEESAERSVWESPRGPHALLVVVAERAGPRDWELEPGVARRALAEPLWILVENRRSDGAFFGAVFEALGGDALRRLCQCSPPPLRYDSPGGNQGLVPLIDHYLDDPAWAGIPRRLLVLTDSDALHPGELSNEAKRIAEHCEARGVACQVLAKRSIEHYLPQETFDAWAAELGNVAARARVEALGRLSDPQRDHFPMKKGFKGAQIPEGQESLYRDVHSADRELLSRGFGNAQILELLTDFRHTLTAETLLERCGPLRGSTDEPRCELDLVVELVCSLL